MPTYKLCKCLCHMFSLVIGHLIIVVHSESLAYTGGVTLDTYAQQ